MNRMNWQSYLRSRTRQPEFLWRMVIWILAAGVGVGYVAEKIYQPEQNQVEVSALKAISESWDTLEVMATRGEWSKVWWGLPQIVYRYPFLGSLALACILGVCWFVFLWQAMHVPSWRSMSFWAAVIAVPLGVLSIWPTLFFSFWLEEAWDLRESEELIPGIRYFVLSVGLREELCKLFCLLPLMPMLLSLRSELTALTVSGCVGLGFAIEENVNYLVSSGGTDSPGRFLTANPLHITLTGLAGLMLYRAIRNPAGWGSHALGVFGMLVFAHGLYDAFIVLPALNDDYGLFVTIIFALVVYQFFHELRELRPRGGETVSLSATFLLGVALMLAATFVYISASAGVSEAFEVLVESIVGLAVMVYLFLREMPESMVTV